MKRILLIGVLLCTLVPNVVQAYTAYYEASGQTMPFKLAAGSTAGWDKTNSPIVAAHKLSKGPFGISSIAAQGGSLRISFCGNLPPDASVSIYSLRGARVANAPVSGMSMSLGQGLADGAYVARVMVKGISVLSSRFTMLR